MLSFTLLPIGVAGAESPPAQAAAAPTLDPPRGKEIGMVCSSAKPTAPVVAAAPIRGRGSCPSGLDGVSLRLAQG